MHGCSCLCVCLSFVAFRMRPLAVTSAAADDASLESIRHNTSNLSRKHASLSRNSCRRSWSSGYSKCASNLDDEEGCESKKEHPSAPTASANLWVDFTVPITRVAAFTPDISLTVYWFLQCATSENKVCAFAGCQSVFRPANQVPITMSDTTASCRFVSFHYRRRGQSSEQLLSR